jgi:hypothetical protein
MSIDRVKSTIAYLNMNKDKFWWTVPVVGALAAESLGACAPATSIAQENSNNSNSQENNPGTETSSHKTSFSWSSNKIEKASKDTGRPVEDISGYSITVEGAATADGNMTIDIITTIDKDGQSNSGFYGPGQTDKLGFLEYREVVIDGKTYVEQSTTDENGFRKVFLRYPGDASARLAAGGKITLRYFPTEFQSTILGDTGSLSMNGLAIEVNPNPKWTKESAYTVPFYTIDTHAVYDAATATSTPSDDETLSAPPTPEFIKLNIISSVEYTDPQGLANVSIRLDESAIFKGVDDITVNENFPGDADAAMAKFTQHFFWKVAKETNENAKDLTYEEYVNAWREYNVDPTNEDAKAKVEFTFFNDATGKMETHTPMNLEFVFGSAKKLEGLNTYLKNHIDGLRIEYNAGENKIVYISGLGDVTEITSYKDFGANLAKAANYLIKYKGKSLTNFNYVNIDESLRDFCCKTVEPRLEYLRMVNLQV